MAAATSTWIALGALGCAAPNDANDAPNDANESTSRVREAISATSSRHVRLGVPHDADPSDDLVLDKGAYVVSYNPSRKIPNWSSWQIASGDLGSAGRGHHFKADATLPAGTPRATLDDYAASGFDRGHLCPSADRTKTPADNALTFLLTNVAPQHHEMNAGPWEGLEDFSRKIARGGSRDVYVVAGPLPTAPSTIGDGVAVPSAFFKVVVVVATGTTAAGVTDAAETVAVVIPNATQTAGKAWTKYLTSIHDVEAQSGYALLDALPPAVRATLRQRTTTPAQAQAAAN